jgi:hypothetical protein
LRRQTSTQRSQPVQSSGRDLDRVLLPANSAPR